MKKTYEKEFKLKICKDIAIKRTTVTEVSKEYSISRPTISRWLAEYQRYKNRAFSGKGNRLPDQAEIYALKQRM